MLNLGSPTKRPTPSWPAAPANRETKERPAATAPQGESPRPRPDRRGLREGGGGPPPPPPGKDRVRTCPTHPHSSVVASTRHVRPSRPDAWIPFSGSLMLPCCYMHCSNCSATARALREELTDTLHSTAPRVRKTAAPLPRAVRERLPPALDRPSVVAGPTDAHHRESRLRAPPLPAAGEGQNLPAKLGGPLVVALLVGEGGRLPCQLFPYRSRQAGALCG